MGSSNLSRDDPAVRVVFDAATVPDAVAPYNTVHLRIAYPAAPAASADLTLGLIPPDPGRLPMPLVIWHPNFNITPDHYHWLARRLALAGYAVVTPSWIARGIDGRPVLSSGIDLEHLADRPNALIDPILGALASGTLAESIDLSRTNTVVGGHSAGGTTALLTAGIKAAFSYGGHLVMQSGEVLTPPTGPARLLLGGSHDGIIGTLSGSVGSAVEKLTVSAQACNPAAEFELIDGADHYAVVASDDGSTGRSYLEQPGPKPAEEVRQSVGDRILDFLSHSP